jgi:hypothetical protein
MRCSVGAFTANVFCVGGNSKSGFNMSAIVSQCLPVIFLGISLLGSNN